MLIEARRSAFAFSPITIAISIDDSQTLIFRLLAGCKDYFFINLSHQKI